MAVEVATNHPTSALARIDDGPEARQVLMTKENREVIQAMAYDVFASGRAYLPEHIKSEEQAKVIMYFGYEIGLPPMASLQHIYVVHGKPSLEGAAMLALLDGRPDLGYYVWGACSNESATITLYKRVPTGEYVPQEFTFTIRDAEQAGIAGDMYKKYPRAMLRWRVVAEGMRATFMGLLAGCAHTPEELGVQMVVDGGELTVDRAALAEASVAATMAERDRQAERYQAEQQSGLTADEGEVDFEAPGAVGSVAALSTHAGPAGPDPMDVARDCIREHIEGFAAALAPPTEEIPDVLGEEADLPPLSAKQLKDALHLAGLPLDDVAPVGAYLLGAVYPDGRPAKLTADNHQAVWTRYCQWWQAGTLPAHVYVALCRAADVPEGANPFGPLELTEAPAEASAEAVQQGEVQESLL